MSECAVKEIRALKELLSSDPVASTSSTSMPGNTPLTLPCRGHSNPTLFARYFVSSRSSALLQNDRSPETFSARERRFRNTIFSTGEVVQSRLAEGVDRMRFRSLVDCYWPHRWCRSRSLFLAQCAIRPNPFPHLVGLHRRETGVK